MEMLPDGTVVRGYRRRRSFSGSDWEDIKVVVKPDRAATEAIEQQGNLVVKKEGKEMSKIIIKMKVAELKPHPASGREFSRLARCPAQGPCR